MVNISASAMTRQEMAGMPALASAYTSASASAAPAATLEPFWLRALLIGVALTFLTLFLFVPLIEVFFEALKKGWDVYLTAISEPDAVAAIRLTLITAIIAVPANLVFGVAAAWTIAKFEFRGKNILLTLIDLPFSVSPIISGLIYVLIFGAHTRYQDIIRRSRHRPGDHVRHLSVCGP
jgi:sulfate transport system permease protein